MSNKRFIAKHGLDNNNQTITNVADPVNSTDVVIKRNTDNLSNTINVVWDTANSGISIAQAAYDAANNVAPQIAPAHQKANAAYNTANNAWASANNAYNTANSAWASANNAYSIASSAYNTANNAWAEANASYTYASSTANNAYITANNAWAAANTANTWLQANDAITLASAKANDYNTLVAAYANDSSTLASSKIYTDNANTWLQANDIITLAAAKNYSNTIYSIISSTANNAYNTANSAWAGANASYTYASSTANNAYNTANSAWDTANSGISIAQAAYDAANNVAPQIAPAHQKANAAYSTANSAWAGANASYTYASSTANNAYNTANSAWATANSKLNSSGGIVSGNLSVTGNVQIDGALSISGNVFSLQANNLSITDNMIYLNRGANTANPDIGIAAGYNDGIYHHAGFFRDATDGIWKVFDNYAPEPDAYVYIDTSNSTFRIANFQANVVYGNTFVSTMQTGIAPFSVTSTTIVPNLNVDYLDGNHGSYYSGLSNTVSDRANTLYSYASSTANNAYNTANSAWARANASYTYASSTANNAYNTANSAWARANASYTYASSTANNAYNTANNAWAGANASYTYASSTANNAYITANNAWNAANTANTYRSNASNLTTGTIPGDRGVTAGSAIASFVEYNGTTKTPGQFDGGSTAPSNSIRLNYDGFFYATNFYGSGTGLTGTATNLTANVANYEVITNATSGTYYPQLVSATSGTLAGYSNNAFVFDVTNLRLGISGNVNIGGDIQVGPSTILASENYTTSNTNQITLDSFPTSTYRTAIYEVQMTSTTNYHTITLKAIHNGTTVYLVQYGEIFTNISLGSFDASISSGNLNLLFTPTNAVTAVKLTRQLILV